RFLTLAPLPVATLFAAYLCWRWAGKETRELRPYLAAMGVFAGGFIGLGVSIFPRIAPYDLDLWDAAAADTALGLMLVGVAIMLPVILGYTAYVYWIFRGKAPAEGYQH